MKILSAAKINDICEDVFKKSADLYDLRVFDFTRAVEAELIKKVGPYMCHKFGCEFEPTESHCTCGLDRYIKCK